MFLFDNAEVGLKFRFYSKLWFGLISIFFSCVCRSHILQAESEKDLQFWINNITTAISKAYKAMEHRSHSAVSTAHTNTTISTKHSKTMFF